MRRLARLATPLPEVLPTAVAGFSLVAVTLLLLGRYRPGLVLPVGAAAALAAGYAASRPATSLRARYASRPGVDLLAVLLAAAFAVVNALDGSQSLVVLRDPGVYSTAGLWLVHHASLPVDTHAHLFGRRSPALDYSAVGYGPTARYGYVYPQGTHVVPALIAAAGWIGGTPALLRTVPVIGSMALLACYGFGRRLAGSGRALLVMLALGLTLPQLYFSRDTYTEPLAELAAFGGLSLLWLAWSGRRWPGYLLAGLVSA